MNKCRVSVNKNTRVFENSIPTTIRDEIKQVVDLTKKTDKEQSLTFCRLKNKNSIFVSDYSVGNQNETYVKPCNEAHGNTAEKIGDLHTHPTSDPNTVGITPSTADISSTFLESVETRIPQISCITGPDAKFIHCYQPVKKAMEDINKFKGYKKALNYDETGVAQVSPYIRENVADDFHHAWYSRKSFMRVKPKPKEVIQDAFINSKKFLKFEDIPDLEKGPFCEVIADLNYPTQDDKIKMECRKVLKVKEFLGFEF